VVFHRTKIDVGSRHDGDFPVTIKDQYEAVVAAGTIVADDAQRQVVDKLEALQQRIAAQSTLAARLSRLLPGKKERPAPRGIYLWGGVGRGKTFLMDLF